MIIALNIIFVVITMAYMFKQHTTIEQLEGVIERQRMVMEQQTKTHKGLF